MDAVTINQGCSQKYVEVLGLKVLSDCDDIGVVLSIANYMKRKFETIEVKWSTMTVASIGRLLRKKGVPSTEMRGIFKDIETQICRKLYRGQVVNEEEHETLGWAELDGNLVFKADAIYTVTGKRLSTYAGSFNIQSSGSLEVFVDMLITHVVGNIPLSAICCMAAEIGRAHV